MGKKTLIIILTLVVLALIACGIGYYYILVPNTEVQDEGIVYFRDNTSIEALSDTLVKYRYIKNINTFQQVAKLKKFNNIKPGRYKIESGLNNNELINFLRMGKQLPIRFTFNNIRTLDEFANVVNQQLSIPADELLSLIHNLTVLEELGFNSNTIIGMFLPNTYEIYWNTSAMDFLKRMKREYERFWNQSRTEKAQEIGLKPIEVEIIASIVEEETIRTEEFSKIAGVYINRIKTGMKLDACPTIKFVLNDFTIGRVLEWHTKLESPYNTYKYAGLPPGPVRMASINVIDAVLNYDHHEYYYFCAKSDFSGYHNFSKTYRQHQIYAREYQNELNKRGIYK